MNEYYDFEYVNKYEGTRNPDGTVTDDLTTWYFTRSLWQRAISVISWKLPAAWNKKYFTNVLFRNGFISVIPTPEYGVIPQINTLTGYGLYLQPTTVLVSQPLVKYHGEIGKDCEVIYLTPDYTGIMDIIEHYALQLSTIYTSIKMSLVNSRLAFVMGAKNKSAAATLKLIAERISAGESTIIYDKHIKEDDLSGEEPIWTEAFNVKDTYITDMLLNDMKTILESFDREIGIPNVNEKKERMLTDEVSMMTNDSCARLDTWRSCLDESIANVNRMFPDLNISYTVKEAVSNEHDSENDADRDV